MPSLADLKKTKEELTLALAELDNLEKTARNIELSGQNGANGQNGNKSRAEEIRLKEKVEFLQQANKELAGKNEELVGRFEKVKSEKDSLKNDIDALRVISQKLQVIILYWTPCKGAIIFPFLFFFLFLFFEITNMKKICMILSLDSYFHSLPFQSDVGKVNEEKSLLSSIVRNTQGLTNFNFYNSYCGK